MAKKTYVRDNVPLSRFGVLVAQLESIVASAVQQPPDALLCFDLLSDLLSAIDDEPKESIILWQRKCEDALYSLLTLGAKRPVRHLASAAMVRIIAKGDSISIYSRTSTLQGFLSDGKKSSDPLRVAGVAQCLGELYSLFGRRITSGLLETAHIAAKLMKFHEDFVRQEALRMLQNAIEGSGGNAAISAYIEAFRFVTRSAVSDKSVIVRVAAARCLNAFANIGGPGLGMGELDNAASSCVKALEDPMTSVRDAFAESLGAILALAMNTNAQVQVRGKGQSLQLKAFDGGLQRHLILPFMKAAGSRSKDLIIGLTFSWVSLLQALRAKQLYSETELQNLALQVMSMLRSDCSSDAQALACVLYILRVGITDQMTEPTQREFLVFLAKQLQSPDASSFMEVAALRMISYLLKILGEVPVEFKEVLDNTVVAAVSQSSVLVRIEAALTLRALAEVDPTCVAGLVSFGTTTIYALRENLAFEKGSTLKVQLESLHGQATVLAALVSISPKLPLGYPARLPKLVLQLSKAMITEYSRNVEAAAVEEQTGWSLLSSLLASMPKEELKDQVFDVLTLWAPLFGSNQESELKNTEDLLPRVNVFSAAIDALTSFIRCFFHPQAVKTSVLLQPVLFYLNRALSYMELVAARDLPNLKPSLDVFVIKLLKAYQSLPDPSSYKCDHARILRCCSTPFRNPSGFEESSSLSTLLDKRDAWLGPSVPGRDWFEDELRAFQGGADGLMPCVWDDELSSFPQPETIGKTLVNQMLLCFGVIFASQDNAGILAILGMIDQCLKTGKKQPWRAASLTNICVGLLAGLKALLSSRSRPFGSDMLLSLQVIFQGILTEVEATTYQRRAASECMGLIARLGDDMFTARMTRLLLCDLMNVSNSNYNGSIAVALGCIHRCAGGMALSSLVPLTVTSISSLARSPIASLQTWSLHGLLLTIEAAGLSYVSHVQETLGLALDILLHDDSGWVDLQQGVGRLINAIVAVIGPELAPGSIFFSRCKSIIAEISACQETATFLESVRFTQQLILFAPQAVSVQTHVRNLQRTLTSRQPILRHLAVSTIRHLVEKDPDSIVKEQIEDSLFHMLDEETDSEINNLVRDTLMRLLYASCPSFPSHWICICRNIVLSISSRVSPGIANAVERENLDISGGETRDSSADDETMVSSYEGLSNSSQVLGSSRFSRKREKHHRFRTRIFAAECLRHLLKAVGNAPAHFDLSLAREATGDWLVLHVQELVSLAYQICTIQLESIQPIGVEVLSIILDKFEFIEDPELPGHLLLEQYQAQLVSACRTALDVSSGPILLEAGLCLATKILTSGIISGDQSSVKRIYSLISRPLDDFKDLYYPSFSEWVSCKIKIRLLVAHASLKCYSYTFLKKQHVMSNEYSGLLPLFAKSSSVLGKYWILFLRDYIYICLGMQHNKIWVPFLDGIQSPLASAKLMSCLKEAWPVIFQAVALDANSAKNSLAGSSMPTSNTYCDSTLSGYSMVDLVPGEFQLMWSFALLNLFQWQNPNLCEKMMSASALMKFQKGPLGDEIDMPAIKVHEIVLPVLQFLSADNFFRTGFHNINLCQELVKILAYFINMDDSWHSLAIPVFLQVVQNCPEEFLDAQSFVYPVMELCVAYLFKAIQETDTLHGGKIWNDLMRTLFSAAKTLSIRLKTKQSRSLLIFLIVGYECCEGAATEPNFSAAREFICHMNSLFKNQIVEGVTAEEDVMHRARLILGGCLTMTKKSTTACIESIYTALAQMPKIPKLLQMKLALYLELAISYAELAYNMVLGKVCEGSDLFILSCLKHSLSVFETTLTNSNIQVRAIALHILYSAAQKGSTSRSFFYMYFMCELSGSIFSTLLAMLKKPAARENMAVVSECVRLLVLMHSLSKDGGCERGLIDMLLEGILLVLSASEDDLSQDIVDVRNLSVKVVSHLAQLPSSAVIFKEALLAMPAPRRQQLQVIIRASVTNNQGTTQLASTSTPLIIKLPAQSVESEVPTRPLDKSEKEEEIGNEVEDNGDDEDDWDAFQSIPATAAHNAAEVSFAQDTTPNSDDDFQSFPAPTPPNEGLDIEFTGEPILIHPNNDKSNALESPSNACHYDSKENLGEEEPTTYDHAKADSDEVLSSPAADIPNVDPEKEFDTDEPQPSSTSTAHVFESETGINIKEPSSVDDHSNEALQSSRPTAVTSKVDSELGFNYMTQADDTKAESNEAIWSSPTAFTPKVDSKSDVDTKEPSTVNGIEAERNKALQPSLIEVKHDIESESVSNTDKTTAADNLANNNSEEWGGSTPESPVCSSIGPELQEANDSLKESSGLRHQIEDEQSFTE